MKTGLILLLVVFAFVIGTVLMLAFIKYVNVDVPENSMCDELGCNVLTKYVGSKNSDKYYSCDCHYAKQISPENIVCFEDDSDAVEKGYTKVDCWERLF